MSKRPASPASRPQPPLTRPSDPPSIDMTDESAVQHWCDRLGITRQQLEEAVKAAGTKPSALLKHLLTQGASAGPG